MVSDCLLVIIESGISDLNYIEESGEVTEIPYEGDYIKVVFKYGFSYWTIKFKKVSSLEKI